jgi:NTE family protein
MPYLGQQDSTLPMRPTDLVPREDVIADPIDFAPVTDQNIIRSAWRGEQLMRLFLVEYCPKL